MLRAPLTALHNTKARPTSHNTQPAALMENGKPLAWEWYHRGVKMGFCDQQENELERNQDWVLRNPRKRADGALVELLRENIAFHASSLSEYSPLLRHQVSDCLAWWCLEHRSFSVGFLPKKKKLRFLTRQSTSNGILYKIQPELPDPQEKGEVNILNLLTGEEGRGFCSMGGEGGRGIEWMKDFI